MIWVTIGMREILIHNLEMQLISLTYFRIRVRNFLYRTNSILILDCLREFRAMLCRKSFSQYGEDKTILSLLSNQKGFYLDIGSGRPISGSNTYALYRLGWEGIAIDPLKNNSRLFGIFRHRDRFLNAVVGADKENVIFYEFEQYVYSTFSREAAEQAMLENNAKIRKIITIKNHLLDAQDLQKLNCSPSVLSIDCEGADFAILQSINLRKYRPSIICIELFRNGSYEFSVKISAYLNENGYELISSTHLNGLFVAREFISSIG